jgi:hypothetical protein
VVKRYWEVCDTVDVAADGVDEAIEAAHALPIDHTKAAYVADSLNSDPESDVQHLPGGVS